MAPRSPALLLGALLALNLSACGGGGGGGDGGTSSATGTASGSTSQSLAITTANMHSVAGAGASTVTTSLSSAQSTSGMVLGAEIQPAIGKGVSPGLAGLALLVFDRAVQHWKQPEVVTGAAYLRAWPCTYGGTMQISAVVKDVSNPTAASGDTFTIVMNNCAEDGVIMDGSLGYTVNSTTGSLSSNGGSVNLTVKFDKFTTTQGAGNTSIDGSATLEASRSANILSGALKSSRLTFGTLRSVKSSTLIINGYDVRFSDDLSNTISWTMAAATSFTFPSLQGGFDVSTLEPVTQDYAGAIQSGRVRLIGNNSTLYLRYIGNDQIRLELDGNNDGVIETTTTSTVTTLSGLVWQ